MHINQKLEKHALCAQTWLLCAALVGCAEAGAGPSEPDVGNLGSAQDTPSGPSLADTSGPAAESAAPAGEADPGDNPETLSDISFLGGGDSGFLGGGGSGFLGGGGFLGGNSNDGGGEVDPGTGGGEPGEISSCLKGITNYFDRGPFQVRQRNSGSIKMWIPQVPAGCKVPMIHISNGTGATCGFYNDAIQRYASHGFLTLCYENANTGAGEYGIQAFEKALQMYPDLADMKFGSSGHSQGGQAAFVTGQFAEERWPNGVHAILAMQPASGFGNQPRGQSWQKVYGKIRQPAAMYSGNPTDGLVSKGWVSDAFRALPRTTEAYHWTKSGVSHFAPNGQSQEMGVAWFRWKLLGDQDACRAFKSVPTRFRGWSVVNEQAVQQCQ